MSDITVVKFGGSLGQDKAAVKKFFDALALMARKAKLVLVHGGGPEVNDWLKKTGIESRFISGLRYTDDRALEVVEMVLSGKVNKTIVAELLKRKIKAVGISAKDGGFIISKRKKELGFTGEPCEIDVKLISTLVKAGFLPVVSSLSIDKSGQTLNVNADSVAMITAAGLKAKRLILVTNVPGVLDKEKHTIPEIRLRNIQGLITDGTVTGGMIPKVKACASAIGKGVGEVVIIDGACGLAKLRGTVFKR